MPERIPPIQLISKANLPHRQLEGASLEVDGKRHIADSINILKRYKAISDMDTHIAAAGHIASAGESPELLLTSFDNLRGYQDAIPSYRAKIFALMGDYDSALQEAEKSATPYDFTFIAQTQMQRGEDPTQAIEREIGLIQRKTKNGEVDPYHLMELGKAFLIVGRQEDGQNIFHKAEEVIDNKAKIFQEAVNFLIRTRKFHPQRARSEAYGLVGYIHFDSDYSRLVQSYTDSGLFSDASRVIGKFEEHSSHVEPAISRLTLEQLKKGLYKDAVVTASKIRPFSFLSQLIGQADNGIQAISVSAETEKSLQEQLANTFNIYDYMQARIILGSHAAQMNDSLTAQAHFDSAWHFLEREDYPEMKTWLMLDFARELDDSGYDATELFHGIFREVYEKEDREWTFGSRWGEGREAVEEAFKRDYFTTGIEGMILFTPSRRRDHDKDTAQMLAARGAAEIRASR